MQVLALEDARSNATLGRVRQGSGVVIGPDGLVLTIGYLVLEADQVQLILEDERSVPARVVGYDVATGFGLLQPLAPLRIAAGAAGRLARRLPDDRCWSPAAAKTASSAWPAGLAAQLRRLLGVPHRGRAVHRAAAHRPQRRRAVQRRGELVGIGSLMVADTRAEPRDGPRLPGNMFVPVDLLPPILAELRTPRMSSASRRAWLGVNCVEQAGDCMWFASAATARPRSPACRPATASCASTAPR